MPRSVLLFAGLCVLLSTAPGFGQPVVVEIRDDVAPPVEPPLPIELAHQGGPAEASDEPLPMDAKAIAEILDVNGPCCDMLHDFWGYRYSTNGTGWIVGDGDQFGMVSLATDHYQSRGIDHGVDFGLKFHFLAGPERTDMPPRVYDFSLAYQHRNWHGDFGYDVAVSVMASSDFEGSSREGIRFPGHAVGFLKVAPRWDLVFGVDYLDRGDIKILPVGGLIVLPHPDIRLEIVFPRPRAVFQLTAKHRLSIGGELGGGSWAIERTTFVDDLATYRDLRLSVGLEHANDDGDWSAFEIAYLFDRKLEYTSGLGDYHPRDTVMIRMTHTY